MDGVSVAQLPKALNPSCILSTYCTSMIPCSYFGYLCSHEICEICANPEASKAWGRCLSVEHVEDAQETSLMFCDSRLPPLDDTYSIPCSNKYSIHPTATWNMSGLSNATPGPRVMLSQAIARRPAPIKHPSLATTLIDCKAVRLPSLNP